MDETNKFEKFPGAGAEFSSEQLKTAAKWGAAMASGVPEFAGEGFGLPKGPNLVTKVASKVGEKVVSDVGEKMFGSANETNEFYGEAKDEQGEFGEKHDDGISDAAALINYGLNAAALEYGVETVVQKLKGFDSFGSEDPIGDFYKYMGIDTPAEYEAVRDEGVASGEAVEAFREGPNAPAQNKSAEGALKAIADMKELISEVEGADPRYEELRQGAKAAGKGYFDYAVSSFGVQGLTELFQVLAAQREMADERESEAKEEPTENVILENEIKEDKNVVAENEDVAVESGNAAVESENAAAEVETGQTEIEEEVKRQERLNPEIIEKHEA